MNILGEGFPDVIINQVKQRQKIYGSGYDSFRTSENLIYLNSNTAWCKLVSSTYIDNIELINNTNIKTLGLIGDQLARQFILFNGTYTQGLDQRSGIDFTGFNPNQVNYSSEKALLGLNSAYGIGGTEFGFNPMMGIQSAVINHKNRGSIRTATVNIKAWNRLQFEIIDILYLRLGFSVLLEWGHSMYYTSPDLNPNNSEFVSNPTGNSLANDFLDGTISYKEFLNRIQEKRLGTFGNYDAMFAKVTNFHWSFKPDGSYDIVLNLVSVGDVVESFKIKGNTPISVKTNNSATPNPPTIEEELAQYAQSSELTNYLYKCVLALKSSKNTNQSCFLYNTSVNTDWTTYWDSNGTFASASNGTSNATKDICAIIPPGGTLGTYSEEVIKNGPPPAPRQLTQVEQDTLLALQGYSKDPNGNLVLNKKPVPVNQWPAFLQEWKKSKDAYASFAVTQSPLSSNPTLKYTKEDQDIKEGKFISKNSYYIRLGNLLQFIQEGIMYQISSPNSNTPNTPILNYDYDIDTNIMHAPPQLMGYDPRLAMVKTNIQFLGGNVPVIPNRQYFNITNGNVNNFAETFDVNQGSIVELGKIMNIYVNFQFILNKLKELENKDTNEVLLLDFLKGILAGINSSFGGYSKLDIFIDETTNTLKIIDQNPLPSVDQTIDYINSLGGSTLFKDLAYFDLYGYNTMDNSTSAGFIKEFDFTTELTPEFSTMISVAATSNGNVVGENNTALSRLNKGLYDKYKQAINGGGAAQQNVNYNTANVKQTLYSNYIKALKEFGNFAIGFKTYIDNLYNGNYINDEIDSYKDSITIYFKLWKKFKKAGHDYYNYDENAINISEINSTQFQPGTGFIPFNLSLKMNGLSGIKLGSRFLIDTSYLPSNYPNTVDFLIKNLSHEIKDNTWTTSLESYCIAKSPKEYKQFPEETNLSSTQTSPQTTVPSVSPNQVSNTAKTVYDFFISKGFVDFQAAAWVGNLNQESSLNPTITNSIGAFGLAQWLDYTNPRTGRTDPRKSRLFAKPNYFSLEVQLDYIWEELQNTERRAYNLIKATTSLQEATLVIRKHYERPAEWEANDASRIAYAEAVFNKFA